MIKDSVELVTQPGQNPFYQNKSIVAGIMALTNTIVRDKNRVFSDFLNRINKEVYSEPDSEMHMALIDKVLPDFVNFIPDKNTTILDVGSGQGYASLKFLHLGYRNLTAITLSDADVESSRARGIECYKMDMSFLGFKDDTFGALWVRHALEHSPFPYLTLLEFNRVLNPKGVVYLEMPMPGTPRRLEYWPNHYSILGEDMWCSLFGRAGFKTILNTRLKFLLRIKDINDGQPFEQTNFLFVLEKKEDQTIT